MSSLVQRLRQERRERMLRLDPRPSNPEPPPPKPEADALPAAPDPIALWVKRQRDLHQNISKWFAQLRKAEPDIETVPVATIQKVVAKHFRVSRLDLVSARRTKDIVMPRQVAMFLAKTLTERSLPDIGQRFGGRDHTTILYGVRKVARLIETNPSFAQEIEALKEELSQHNEALL